MITLSDKAIKAIKDSTKLKGELQLVLGISSNTLYSWVKKNDAKLTQASALDAIKKHSALTDADLLITLTP